MADIFLAKSTSMAGVERHVVLKRVLAEHASKPQFAKMFLDEARIAMHLQHPNIAQVHDVGVLAGSYFFTMEYVHGKDVRGLLRALAAAKRMLPINHVLYIVSGALSALHHAHTRTTTAGVPLNVVHRDVTPSNLMVSYEGTVKLLDFGVAKATQNSEETRTGTIKGKIGYLSPEQCSTSKIDRRADIFSLGILMHEMLTRRRLYRRESDFLTMNAIVNEPTTAPSEHRSEVSGDLDRVVLRALEKRPDDRFSTAAEMLDAIDEIAARERHVLSAVAASRFMRELFGEHVEPWRISGEDLATPMTVKGRPLAPLATANPMERALAAQLEGVVRFAAPSHDSAPSSSLSGAPISDLHVPEAAVSESRPPDAPPLLPSPATLSQGRKWPRWSLLAVVLLSTTVALYMSLGRSQKEAAPEAEKQIAPVATITPLPPTVESGSQSPPVDAGSIDQPRRTIASAMNAANWLDALQLCVASDGLTNDEYRDCAIAACNRGQREAALDYYREAPSSSRPAIERACKVGGISLRDPPPMVRRPAARPTTPQKVDPCELDPLQCQK